MSGLIRDLKNNQHATSLALLGVKYQIMDLEAWCELYGYREPERAQLSQLRKKRWNLEKQLDRITTAIFALENEQ